MREPMLCPGCGGVMNHHADKVVYGEEGEHMEEFHQCPSCGTGESRPAE